MAAAFFYISGHGFGHASREVEVLNALGAAAPDIEIVVRSSASRRLFERTIRVPFTLLEGATDTGVVQVDSLRLDEAETIRQATAFYATLGARAAAESAILRRHDARIVVADAPPLACAAAAGAGVPSFVLSNFTWDWIYEGYPEHLASAPGLIPTIKAAYAQARAGWRLPLGGGFDAVPNVRDIPFIARHASRGRLDTRRALHLPADRPLVLSSFGGYGVRDLDLGALDCLAEYGVVITRNGPAERPPEGVWSVDEIHLYASGLRYEDLVGAVDVVVTKPGYGIVAECLANDTAMLYTSRGRFVEYDVMVAAMPRILRCAHITHDDLFAGRWRAPLDHVLRLAPPPDRPPTNGAAVGAASILQEIKR